MTSHYACVITVVIAGNVEGGVYGLDMENGVGRTRFLFRVAVHGRFPREEWGERGGGGGGTTDAVINIIILIDYLWHSVS